MPVRDEIVKQVLSLPPEDRAYLAEKLEESLPDSGFTSAEIAKAWGREIDRRLSAFDSGQTQAASFDETLLRIRQRLAEHRQRRAATC